LCDRPFLAAHPNVWGTTTCSLREHLPPCPGLCLQLLNYERCEFLLVGAHDDLHAELGGGAEAAVEAPAQQEEGRARQCPDSDEECMLESLKEEIQAEVGGQRAA
jgi:hypothetical protein